MKTDSLYRVLAILSILSIFLLSTWGCIKEGTVDCKITIALRVHNLTDAATVTDAVIYVFESDGSLLESRPTQLNQPEVFSYNGTSQLTIVGWCNISGDQVFVTPLVSGDPISQGAVSLISRSMVIDTMNIYNSPSDLFYGSETISHPAGNENIELYADRMVGAMNVTVIGLKAYAGLDDDHYSIVTGTTWNTINFQGQFAGSQAGYMPSSSFNSSDELKTNNFLLFPSLGMTLYVSIFHENEKVFETAVNNNGTPLQAESNKTLNVLIDLREKTSIEVTIIKSEWEDVYEWEKTYN